MNRRLAFPALMVAILVACSEPIKAHSPAAFTGRWRSVTPSYEHLRLTVSENPELTHGLHVRLAFSGVMWEGPGRIEADSLIIDVSTAPVSGAKVVARANDSGALSVNLASSAASPLQLIFVRDSIDTP